MKAEFFTGNRNRLYSDLKPGSLLLMYAGEEIRKTSDEYYPFFAERNFVYLTGLTCKQAVLLAMKDVEGTVSERLYILPPDAFEERWTGVRVKPQEAETVSGVSDIKYVDSLEEDFHRLAVSGNYGALYLDLYRCSPEDIDRPSHRMLRVVQEQYPYLQIENANILVRKLRTIKQPCEIEALREAEKITKSGILAMMQNSKPGMYEYQYKAEFDRALGQYGPQCTGFPPIISAGANNFCIHYYEYTGQSKDGDMILNDVGAQYDNLITDVSRGWPCNGRFTDRQKVLYECALATSDHMFSIIRPGMKMDDVDATIRSYNCERLKEAGVLKSADEISTYMWHGGAHHIGYDTHDMIRKPETIAPGMVFCVDVGIYHEEWGIGFRVEDNCLVTESGCENISRDIPRTIADIEAVMN